MAATVDALDNTSPENPGSEAEIYAMLCEIAGPFRFVPFERHAVMSPAQ